MQKCVCSVSESLKPSLRSSTPPENPNSPWDGLQAANALDLPLNFNQHAAKLRPVVNRVGTQLRRKMKTGPAENRQGLGYVEQCVQRLAARLEP